MCPAAPDVCVFPRGASRYLFASLLSLPTLRSRNLVFTVDGQRSEFSTPLWAVGNTAFFGGGMAICPEAQPDDGLLSLVLASDIGRVCLSKLLTQVFKGKHVHHDQVHTLTGSEITVTGEACETCEFDGDGEPLGFLPVTFTAERAALKLAVA